MPLILIFFSCYASVNIPLDLDFYSLLTKSSSFAFAINPFFFLGVERWRYVDKISNFMLSIGLLSGLQTILWSKYFLLSHIHMSQQNQDNFSQRENVICKLQNCVRKIHNNGLSEKKLSAEVITHYSEVLAGLLEL